MSQKERMHELLYSNDDRVELCERICNLEAENVKLRGQLEKSEEGRERQADNLINKCHTIARIQTSNAKLRKLAADLLKGFECGYPSDVCGDCERDAEGMPTHGCPLRNRARKLGVEVDAWA